MKMKNVMEMMKKQEVSYTENGAVGDASTGSNLVDLNFKIPSFRSKGIDKNLFFKAIDEDKVLALKWLLYLRDVREGVGERASFRDFFVAFADSYEKDAKRFLQTVKLDEYGRWDDYLYIAFNTRNTSIRTLILDIIAVRLVADVESMKKGESVSLLAKWLPSENASSMKTKEMAVFIRKHFGYTSKKYRKTLSKLRAYLDVVERKMSSNTWGEIDYEAVPSIANLKYRNAFMEHDTERRAEFLKSLSKGTAKINANAMFLHDIVHAYIGIEGWGYSVKDYDESLEQMWKAQEKIGTFKNTLVMRDGSGSMYCPVGNTNVTAMDVADAVTLYCAENSEGFFHNTFMTFSHRPKIVSLADNISLQEKLIELRRNDDIDDTNIEAAFLLILNTAKRCGLSQEEIPKTILVISDMEYNYCTENPSAHLFESIKKKYEEAGYMLPKLVFWNVNSRSNTLPLTENENGVILMSGFSKNLVQMAMSSEIDPYKALVAQLNVPRYEIVERVFTND